MQSIVVQSKTNTRLTPVLVLVLLSTTGLVLVLVLLQEWVAITHHYIPNYYILFLEKVTMSVGSD